MENVGAELPDGTVGPFVNTDYGDVAIATIAVTGDGFDLAGIEDVAESLQRDLYRLDGIASMLLGSWLTALYILPFLAARLLKQKNKKADSGEATGMLAAYGVVTRRLMGFGVPLIVVIFAVVGFSMTQFAKLKPEMFPFSERADFLIFMEMPKDAAISETERIALKAQEWLLDKEANSEILNATVYVGSGGPRFNLGLNPADPDPASAFSAVNTSSLEAAIDRLPDLVKNESDWGNKVLKVVVDIAQDKAREFSLTSEVISEVMDAYFSGTVYSTFREGDEQIPIMLRASLDKRDSIEDLANLTVAAGGELISIDQVAPFQPKLEYSEIRRENQVRQITNSAKSNQYSAQKMLAAIQPTLDDLDLGAGYEIEIAGELEDSTDVYSPISRWRWG